jgi:hypothetical protein
MPTRRLQLQSSGGLSKCISVCVCVCVCACESAPQLPPHHASSRPPETLPPVATGVSANHTLLPSAFVPIAQHLVRPITHTRVLPSVRGAVLRLRRLGESHTCCRVCEGLRSRSCGHRRAPPSCLPSGGPPCQSPCHLPAKSGGARERQVAARKRRRVASSSTVRKIGFIEACTKLEAPSFPYLTARKIEQTSSPWPV